MKAYLVALVLSVWITLTYSQINSPGAISRYSPGGQYIMLTFSGGPHHYATPKILNILKEQKAKATFFVTGFNANNYKELVSRISSEGHEIGNHGYHPHRSFLKLTTDEIISSVNQTNKVISEVTIKASIKHFRPPNGLTNADVNQVLKRNGAASVVLWSLDSRDVQEPNPTEITKLVLKKAVPGDIILMHDSTNQTINALPDILKGLYKQGYEFLTISDVASFPDDSPH